MATDREYRPAPPGGEATTRAPAQRYGGFAYPWRATFGAHDGEGAWPERFAEPGELLLRLSWNREPLA